MPVSKHRKAHKQKKKSRQLDKVNKLRHIENLMGQLETAMQTAPAPEISVPAASQYNPSENGFY